MALSEPEQLRRFHSESAQSLVSLTETLNGKVDRMNMEVRTISTVEMGLAKTGGSSLLPGNSSRLSALGDTALMRRDKFALLCSVRCPGDLILRAYEYAKKLRDDGVTVIGGFHSPVEKECLRILLRGTQPVIICPARGLMNMRIPADWQLGVKKGTILLLSPFTEKQKRATSELALERNRFVVATADRVCFIYTTPGGALESLANDVQRAGTPIVPLP